MPETSPYEHQIAATRRIWGKNALAVDRAHLKVDTRQLAKEFNIFFQDLNRGSLPTEPNFMEAMGKASSLSADRP